MRFWGILAFLVVIGVVFSQNASAVTEDIEITKSSSYYLHGVNISLINLNEDKGKVLLCINDLPKILREDELNTLNHLELEIEARRIYKSYTKFRVNLPKCDDCVCEGSCLNLRCFNSDLCETDSDCDDGDENTEDACVGAPRNCYYVKVEKNINKEEPVNEQNTNETLENESDKGESLKTNENMLSGGEIATISLFALMILLITIVLWKKIK